MHILQFEKHLYLVDENAYLHLIANLINGEWLPANSDHANLPQDIINKKIIAYTKSCIVVEKKESWQSDGITYFQKIFLTDLTKVAVQYIYINNAIYYKDILYSYNNKIYYYAEDISSFNELPFASHQIRQIYNDKQFLLILTTHGDVYAKGTNTNGRLTRNAFNMPALFKIDLPPIAEICIHDDACVARTYLGKIYVWGNNRKGQLYYGGDAVLYFPVKLNINPVRGIVAVNANFILLHINDNELFLAGKMVLNNNLRGFNPSTSLKIDHDIVFIKSYLANAFVLLLTRMGDVLHLVCDKFNQVMHDGSSFQLLEYKRLDPQYAQNRSIIKGIKVEYAEFLKNKYSAIHSMRQSLFASQYQTDIDIKTMTRSLNH